MKILSWNIWFDQRLMDERMKLIVKGIDSTNADVVCLQEIIPKSLEILIKHFEPKGYNFYPRKMDKSYGTIIMSKIPVISFVHIPFRESQMHRHFLMIRVQNQKEEIISIATSHLESEFHKHNPTKLQQFKNVLDIAKKQNKFIWIGDSNILNHEQEKVSMLCKNVCHDVANLFNKLQNTYDSSLNTNIMDNKKSRPDRAYVKNIPILSYDLVGTTSEPIYNGRMNVFPSDHFGIYVTL